MLDQASPFCLQGHLGFLFLCSSVTPPTTTSLWPHYSHPGLTPYLVLSQPGDKDIQPQQCRRPVAMPSASHLCAADLPIRKTVSPLLYLPWCCFSRCCLPGQGWSW